MQNSGTKGAVCVFICGMLWSTAGLFIKLLPWNAVVIAGLRSGIAAVVMYIYMVIFQKEHTLVVNRHTALSAVFLCGTMLLFVAANKLTTSANAIVLQSTASVFVLLYGILVQHQKPNRRDIVTTVCVFAGILLFFLDQLTPTGILGNFVALGSAFTYCGVILTSADAADEHSSSSGLILGHVLTFIVGLPFIFTTAPEFTASTVPAILFLGIFQLGIAYSLFSHGSRYCSPLAMVLIAMVEPIFSPIWVAIFAHEIPGTLALIGAALVLVSLTAWSVLNAKSVRNGDA